MRRMEMEGYKRSASSFRETVYGKWTIRTMVSTESTVCAEDEILLVSIAGPGLPSIRLEADGTISALSPEDAPDNAGLLIFGTSKFNRPVISR
jgi:hypothetical protein